MLKIFYIIIFLLIVSNNLTAKDKLEKVSLQLHWKYQFEFAGFIMAKEKGFYKDVGLDVQLKEYQFGLDIEDAVLKGKSNYGIYSSAILLSYMQGKDLKLLSSFFKRSAMVLVTKPNIKEPKDLIGKTIMADTKKDFDLKFKYMFNTKNINTNTFHLVKHTYDIDDFKKENIDAIAAFISDQPYKLDAQGIKYNILDPSDYGVYSLLMELFTSKEEAKKYPYRTTAFRDASIKGWEYALNHKNETINIIRKKYAPHFSKDILQNEAQKIEKLILPFAYKIGSINNNFLKKQKELFQKEYNIKNNKTLEGFIFDIEKTSRLNTQEKEYIKNKKVINICTNPNWQPIEFLNNGTPHGISIDTLKIVANKLNLKLNFIKTSSWKESQIFLKEKKCDILPSAIKTSKREKFANFTQPYLKYNLAIITKNNKPLVRNLESIVHKSMSRKSGSGLITKLKNIYPKIEIMETKGYKEAFEKVLNEDVYFTIATLPVLDYYKNKYKLDDLQIAGYTKMKYNLRIAVRKDDIILLSCLNKILSIIPKETHNIIYDKWVKKEILKELDYSLIYKIFIGVFIIILFFIYRNHEMKKYTKQLEKQKELYDLVFENSSNGVLMIDIKSGKFVKCNHKIVKMLNYKTKKDILNLKPSQLSPKYQPDGSSSEEKSKEMIKYAINNGTNTFEWKHIKSCGEEFWAEIILTSIILDNNPMLHVVWKNIDERKQARAQLENINKTLEIKVQEAITQTQIKEKMLQQQSRLAQMGEMINMIAHQWRQPLGAISSSVIAIQSKLSIGKFDLSVQSDREKFLLFLDKKHKNIHSYVQNLSETIDDFRNFFKHDKQKESISLCTPINRALKIVEQSILSKGIQISCNFKSNDKIMIYQNEIMQVILNILKNSEDTFTENNTLNPQIHIETSYNNSKYTISISDNGGGIPKNILGQIFDPYFSTKDKKNGTGIGLYMSKIMIEEHHKGYLNVLNTEDGACFEIELHQNENNLN